MLGNLFSDIMVAEGTHVGAFLCCVYNSLNINILPPPYKGFFTFEII